MLLLVVGITTALIGGLYAKQKGLSVQDTINLAQTKTAELTQPARNQWERATEVVTAHPGTTIILGSLVVCISVVSLIAVAVSSSRIEKALNERLYQQAEEMDKNERDSDERIANLIEERQKLNASNESLHFQLSKAIDRNKQLEDEMRNWNEETKALMTERLEAALAALKLPKGDASFKPIPVDQIIESIVSRIPQPAAAPTELPFGEAAIAQLSTVLEAQLGAMLPRMVNAAHGLVDQEQVTTEGGVGEQAYKTTYRTTVPSRMLPADAKNLLLQIAHPGDKENDGEVRLGDRAFRKRPTVTVFSLEGDLLSIQVDEHWYVYQARIDAEKLGRITADRDRILAALRGSLSLITKHKPPIMEVQLQPAEPAKSSVARQA